MREFKKYFFESLIQLTILANVFRQNSHNTFFDDLNHPLNNYYNIDPASKSSYFYPSPQLAASLVSGPVSDVYLPNSNNNETNQPFLDYLNQIVPQNNNFRHLRPIVLNPASYSNSINNQKELIERSDTLFLINSIDLNANSLTKEDMDVDIQKIIEQDIDIGITNSYYYDSAMQPMLGNEAKELLYANNLERQKNEDILTATDFFKQQTVPDGYKRIVEADTGELLFINMSGVEMPYLSNMFMFTPNSDSENATENNRTSSNNLLTPPKTPEKSNQNDTTRYFDLFDDLDHTGSENTTFDIFTKPLMNANNPTSQIMPGASDESWADNLLQNGQQLLQTNLQSTPINYNNNIYNSSGANTSFNSMFVPAYTPQILQSYQTGDVELGDLIFENQSGSLPIGELDNYNIEFDDKFMMDLEANFKKLDSEFCFNSTDNKTNNQPKDNNHLSSCYNSTLMGVDEPMQLQQQQQQLQQQQQQQPQLLHGNNELMFATPMSHLNSSCDCHQFHFDNTTSSTLAANNVTSSQIDDGSDVDLNQLFKFINESNMLNETNNQNNTLPLSTLSTNNNYASSSSSSSFELLRNNTNKNVSIDALNYRNDSAQKINHSLIVDIKEETPDVEKTSVETTQTSTLTNTAAALRGFHHNHTYLSGSPNSEDAVYHPYSYKNKLKKMLKNMKNDSENSAQSLNGATSSSRAQETRDQLLMSENGIHNLQLGDIINLEADEFNELIKNEGLSADQLSIVKDIRRRAKNKIAAQICRKRKIDSIDTLRDDVTSLKEMKSELQTEHSNIQSEIQKLTFKFDELYKDLIGSDFDLNDPIVIFMNDLKNQVSSRESAISESSSSKHEEAEDDDDEDEDDYDEEDEEENEDDEESDDNSDDGLNKSFNNKQQKQQQQNVSNKKARKQ